MSLVAYIVFGILIVEKMNCVFGAELGDVYVDSEDCGPVTLYCSPHPMDPRADDECVVCLAYMGADVVMPMYVDPERQRVVIAIAPAPLSKCRVCGVVLHTSCLMSHMMHSSSCVCCRTGCYSERR